jgi:hypothetical protein
MTQPADRLYEFADAVESGDRERAEELAREVAASFEDLTAEESAAVRRSLLGRREADPDDLGTLGSHAGASLEVTLLRSSVLLAALAALESSEDPDTATQEVRDLATELKAADERLSDEEAAAGSVVRKETVPAGVIIAAVRGTERPMAIDGETTVSVTLRNPGDEPAQGVAVTATTGAGLGVSPREAGVGRIPGGGEREVSFTVAGRLGGEQAVELEVSSAEAGTDLKTVSVRVLGTGEEPDTDTPSDGDGGIPGWLGIGSLAGGAALHRHLTDEGDGNGE